MDRQADKWTGDNSKVNRVHSISRLKPQQIVLTDVLLHRLNNTHLLT